MINKHILSLTTLALFATSQASAEKKNILFIAVDDLKPTIGAYGDKAAITPNIDRLAGISTLFQNAYCQQALSGASRASLLTGWRPDHTKVWDLETMIRDINPEVVTLPQYFKQNDYFVTGVGKIYDPRTVDKQLDERSWSVPYHSTDNMYKKKPLMAHFQSEQTKAEYDKIYNEGIKKGLKPAQAKKAAYDKIKYSTECIDIADTEYADGLTTQVAVEIIENYDQDQPLFLAVGYKKPHLPFVAPKKYWDMYDRSSLPMPEFTTVAKNSPKFAYHKSGELHSYSDIKPVSTFDENDLTVLPESKVRELIHGYYACVSYTDAQVGLLIDALEEKDMLDNTIIILWGDHGWHLGDHGMWNKHSNFEQAVKVPMMIYDPSSKSQEVLSPAEFVDIYPTLCDLAGIDVPANLDGDNLAPIIRKGKKAANRLAPYAVSQYHRVNKMGYSLRDERYRYTIWVDWTKRKLNADKVYAVELYDYKEDPNETKNIAKDKKYAEVVNTMNAYWEEYKANYIK